MGLFGSKNNEKRSDFIVKHMAGLDMPEGATCQVAIDENTVTVTSNTSAFELNSDRMNSISYELDVDVERYQKSSLIGGVAGAAIFGTSGAVIGSRAKTKEKRNVTCCVTINYSLQNGEGIYLLFQDTTPESHDCALFHDALKPLIIEKPICPPKPIKI